MGRDFLGCCDVIDDKLVLMKKGHASGKIGDDVNEDIVCQGVANKSWIIYFQATRWKNYVKRSLWQRPLSAARYASISRWLY